MKHIVLNWEEAELAANTGVKRQIESMKAKLKDRHGYAGDGFDIHILGAAGEMAVAKALNVFWSPSVNAFGSPDIGDSIQVRTSEKDEHNLIIRPSDSDDHIFFLATGKIPEFKIWGSIKGDAAKQVKWLKSPGGRAPAFFVPKEALDRIGLDICVPK